MRLVEQHIITQQNSYWEEMDCLSFLSKNLYNKGTFLIKRYRKQHNNKLPSGNEFYYMLRDTEAYQFLPQKVAGQIRLLILSNWYNWLKALKEYKINPEKFKERPKPPEKYKNRYKRFPVIYPYDAISNFKQKQGNYKLSKTNIIFHTNQVNIKQVRLIPKNRYYILEVVYEKENLPQYNLDINNISGIDLGVNNLAILSSNKSGFQPLLVNGKPLKSINQYYNKILAIYKNKLAEQKAKYKNGKKQNTSKKIASLIRKRDCKIKDYLHKTSRFIVSRLIKENIGTLILGYNENWKQKSNIGKKNNQNFQSIPFYKFINMLQYKAFQVGIQVIFQEESYTSKCSFLDNETIEHHDNYLGKRVKRGLFRSASGNLINADLNGSYNIIRKAIPDAFAGKRNRGCVVHPVEAKINFGFSLRK